MPWSSVRLGTSIGPKFVQCEKGFRRLKKTNSLKKRKTKRESFKQKLHEKTQTQTHKHKLIIFLKPTSCGFLTNQPSPPWQPSHQAPSLRRRMVERNSWCLAPSLQHSNQRWLVREMFFSPKCSDRLRWFWGKKGGSLSGWFFVVWFPNVQGRWNWYIFFLKYDCSTITSLRPQPWLQKIRGLSSHSVLEIGVIKTLLGNHWPRKCVNHWQDPYPFLEME